MTQTTRSIGRSTYPRLDASAQPNVLPAIVVAAVCSIAAVVLSGHIVGASLVALLAVALLSAVIDARIARIPNRASIAALAIAVGSIPLVVVFDNRPIVAVALGVLAGIAYSGAPLLFAVWLVRPAAIGGGDWKLLGTLGAGLGLAMPIAALVMATIACTVQVVASIVRRRREMPFAPSIATGLSATLLLLPVLSTTFGGPYA